MTKRITSTDRETIRLALDYAIIERDGFANATYNSVNDKVAHDSAKALVQRFEQLYRKMFDSPSDFAQQKIEDRNAQYVSIFDLAKRDR